MSGIFKAIGRVFKKIAKVALPVLAVAAVALTGGAALGILPKLGVTIGKLGLSKAFTGVLVTAAKGATIGAATSLVTGRDPLKGATSGLIAGGMLGGVSLALGGVNGAAGAANAAKTGATTGAAQGGTAAATGAAPAGLDGAWSQFAPGADVAANAGAGGAVSSAAAGAASGIGGGIDNLGSAIGGIFKNPITAGLAIQGIGAGISASSQAAERRREDQQIRDNYSQYAGVGTAPVSAAPYIGFDPATGRIISKGA